ncbi:hypothetical protein EMCRGX_G025050 [Ephydatia muelleri]
MPGPDYLRCIRTQSGRSLAGGQRMSECVVEGPPRTTSGPEGTQDSTALVDLTDSAPDLLEKQVSSHEFHVVQVEGQPSFQTLHQLYQGDQVIVRGNDVTMVTSLINIIKELVPDSCCRIVSFSQTYKESFVCNFLGLAVGGTLPHHVVESEYHVLLDILSLVKIGGSKAAIAEQQGTSEEALHRYKLVVYSGGARNVEQKCPLYLKRLTSLLSGGLSEALFSRGLRALKDEWMNKVKVLYKFSQMGGLDVPQRNDRLQRLLNEVLQVTQEDLPILQNWRSALSKEYKTHLMHSN